MKRESRSPVVETVGSNAEELQRKLHFWVAISNDLEALAHLQPERADADRALLANNVPLVTEAITDLTAEIRGSTMRPTPHSPQQ